MQLHTTVVYSRWCDKATLLLFFISSFYKLFVCFNVAVTFKKIALLFVSLNKDHMLLVQKKSTLLNYNRLVTGNPILHKNFFFGHFLNLS